MHALRELIAEHQPYVRASLRYLGVGAEQLDDAEQDVFLVVVRRRDDFDPQRGTSYRGWMWGMCRNVAATYHRHRRKAQRHDTAAEIAARPPFEERVAAHQVLSTLDERSRVLWLGRCEGRSAQQLADTLALPLTTVQWRLRQARHAVKAALRELSRNTGAWIGWCLRRRQQGLGTLAIPAFAVLMLAQPASRETPGSKPRALLQAFPNIAAVRVDPRATRHATDGDPRPRVIVAHVEEREPNVRAVDAKSAKAQPRGRASGRVALGDPHVDHP
ncbi:MAG: sigma-70 family RNA polymerase sigma factor [Nannocystaceae bacterium]|nr:sigma-70 family RNA polymerase sigma factor [Nannocystaceae bacterium]